MVAGVGSRGAAALASLIVCSALVIAAPALAAPAPLSAQTTRPSIASTSGSGSFGLWVVDRFGLPAYRYEIDETRDARARQPEIGGSTDAWSQVGNDAITAAAFNHGYTQLWSQARVAQWANRYDAGSEHFAGGFGYLRTGAATSSTLYLDRRRGAHSLREFGVGYARSAMHADSLRVDATVTAPFGDDPVVVHEIVLRNPGSRARKATWFEYWDVNPYDQQQHRQRGLARPRFDARRRTLSVTQAATALDHRPLSIFLAAADTRVAGFDTDARAFFGTGGRAAPAAVTADRARSSRAPAVADGQVGQTLFALRTPVTIPARGSVRLRYVYGMAHAAAIPALVRRVARVNDTNSSTARRWAAWLPRADLGASRRWLARELTWDAYMVRSASQWEEGCGHHVITQGGYYQYGLGEQLAYRDPLQHLLPMIYAAPALARDVLRYSLIEQDAATGEVPYGMGSLCRPVQLGRSNDMDVWLLLAVSEYVLATRDTRFLGERLPYADRGRAGTVLEHVQLAVRHQESIGLGPGGQYNMTSNGDWSDFSTLFAGLTESTLVTAQLAYVYPHMAQAADLAGAAPLAQQLRALGQRDLVALKAQWTSRGWYSRGYRGAEQAGTGVIYGEPQPWALLAGAPGAVQASSLVSNIRRYLQGIGAPGSLGGPSRIGASMSPASDDPGVTERTKSAGVGDRNAVFAGGTWFALNGPLVWALGDLDAVVPRAADLALDELEHNTLHAHATAYPDHWSGILDVDDACRSFFSTAPERCGIDVLLAQGASNGHVTHQPAWSLMSMVRLAGITPTREGYTIAPHLPLARFSMALPEVGIEARPHALRGYLRTGSGGRVVLTISPRGLRRSDRVSAWVAGRRATVTRTAAGTLRLTLPTTAGRAADWALSWS
jgi:glycosyl hydrolase family 36/glycosyl transferase family 36